MMFYHLKHTLILLSVGLMLFSCSSDEPAASRGEMKFDISAISRSAVTTASNVTDKPFALFGDMIPFQIADNPSARTTIYYNTPVTFINSAWTTPAPQYWYDGHLHSFVALHPASVLSATGGNATTGYLNSRLSFSYTLPSDYRQTADILAATHRRHYTDSREYDKDGKPTGGTADVVYLRFAHLLSQINFAAVFSDNLMDEEAYIEFHKLELSGFKSKADFNISPAPLLTGSQTDDKVIEVTPQDEEGKLAIDFTVPKKVMNDSRYIGLLDADDIIIMLPQTFGTGSAANVLITYTVNNDPTVKQISLPLENQKWESGKSYTFRFSIDRTGAHYGSTTITDWDTADVGDIDIH